MNHKEALILAISTWYKGESFHGDENDTPDMEAAIRAYLDARGLVMLPKEPTREMQAAFEADYVDWFDEKIEDPDHLYKVMLAAAPDPFKEV